MVGNKKGNWGNLFKNKSKEGEQEGRFQIYSQCCTAKKSGSMRQVFLVGRRIGKKEGAVRGGGIRWGVPVLDWERRGCCRANKGEGMDERGGEKKMMYEI